jgi:thioredoxin 1
MVFGYRLISVKFKNKGNMSDYFIQVHSGNFDSVVMQSKVPVILEFGASWCGTCHILEPILKKLYTEFQHKICIGKLDHDKDQQLFTRYGIYEIPTILIFFQGNIVDVIKGALPQGKIVQKLELLFLDL